MAARTRKAAKKKTPKRAQPDKYKDSNPAILKMMVIEQGLVNRKGEIAWKKVAKILSVTQESLRRWRNKLISGKPNKYYKPAFADAAVACAEEVEAGRIKRSLIDRAKGFVLKKTVKETRETPDGEITVERTEKTQMGCDVAAARICLANLGPKEQRWTDKHQVDVADARLTDTECDNIRAVLAKNLEES